MIKPKVKITIVKEDVGYSAHTLVKNKFIATEAETFDILLNKLLEAINFTFEKEEISYKIGKPNHFKLE